MLAFFMQGSEVKGYVPFVSATEMSRDLLFSESTYGAGAESSASQDLDTPLGESGDVNRRQSQAADFATACGLIKDDKRHIFTGAKPVRQGKVIYVTDKFAGPPGSGGIGEMYRYGIGLCHWLAIRIGQSGRDF